MICTISRKALKLLKWFAQNDDWHSESDLASEFPDLDYRLLPALKKEHCLEKYELENLGPVMDDFGNDRYPVAYRISDFGRGYLEAKRVEHWREVRNWISLAIAVAAFIKSFFFI